MSKDIKYLLILFIGIFIISFTVGLVRVYNVTNDRIRSSETGEDITYAVCKELQFKNARTYLDSIEWRMPDNITRVVVYLNMEECGFEEDQYRLERNY